MEKQIPETWIEWTRTCYKDQTDFDQMRNILIEHFDSSSVNHLIDVIWNEKDEPLNFEYNSDHQWFDVENTSTDLVQVEVLHTRPTVAVLKNILSSEECDHIVNSYTGVEKEQRARVFDHATGKDKVDRSRTNSLFTLEYGEHPTVVELEKRIAEITQIDIRRGESSQILHYRVGEEFIPHDDLFHNDKEFSRVREHGQRIATVITYLNDVDEGGETHFPSLNITVPPKKGDAVYFEYTDSNGFSTEKCRHAGTPVIRGEKWAITKWLRLGYPMTEKQQQQFYR